jgi:hypothetical protein
MVIEKEKTLFSWIEKNAAIILTTITTILVAYLTLHGSSVEKQEDYKHQTIQRRHDDSLFTIDYNYKKAQLIQSFMPFILSKDSTTVKLALLSFYTMDTTFAINTANTLNTEGAQGALNTIFLRKAKSGNKLVASKNNASAPASSGSIALSNAFLELNRAKAAKDKGQDLIAKYLLAAGASARAQWNVPFIIWCFQNNQSRKLDIKTTDLTEFYQELKRRNYIIDATATPQPGDIVFFNFQENKGAEQCGIISNVDNTYVYTIEADNDGEAVSSHIRYKADAMAFARIK